MISKALLGSLGTLAGIGFLFLVFRDVSLDQVVSSARVGDGRWILFAIAIAIITPLLRALRWRYLFLSRQQVDFRSLLRSLLISQMLNVLVPFRLGDVARISLRGPSVRAIAQSLVAERLMDGFMLLVLVTVLSVYPAPAWASELFQTARLAGVAILAVALVAAWKRAWWIRVLERVTAKFGKAPRAVPWVEALLEAPAVLWSRPRALAVHGISVVSVIAAVVLNYALLAALSIDVPVIAALVVLVVLQVGTAAPSAPAKLGLFQYLCVVSLSWFSVEPPIALSYSLLLHVIALGIPTLLGALALGWELKRRGFRVTLLGRQLREGG